MAKKSTTTTKKTKAAPAVIRDLLAEAVQARTAGTMLMATPAEMAHLVNDPRGPMVEFNENMRDGDKIAFRATELGAQVHASAFTTGVPAPAAFPPVTQAAVPAPVTQAQAPVTQAQAPVTQAQAASPGKAFAFATGIPLPPARRGGRGSAVYGFENMAVGVSFFIPATADNPNPAKRIASTVSSASKRLEPRKFIVRSVAVDTLMAAAWNVPVGTKGAGVWRTE